MLTYGCNLSCNYCFQRPVVYRRFQDPFRLDLEAVKRSVLEVVRATGHSEVVLHGGEPLIVPIRVLEDFMDWAVRQGLRVAIQTNGMNITPKHIELFKRYGVKVGVSVDGFPDINTLRGFFAGGRDVNPIASDVYRRRLLKNLEMLARECPECQAGVIILLHRANVGSREKLDRLVEFIRWLKEIGVTGGRLNPMYSNLPEAREWELSEDELYNAYVYIWERIRGLGVVYSPYYDIVSALLGDFGRTVCWFAGCGYYESHVWTVLPDGTVASCDRALASGFWTRASIVNQGLSSLRVKILGQVYGGKYRYWHVHRFGCPAEAPYSDGVPDWRYPSRFSGVWDRLVEYFSRELKALYPWYRLTSDYPDPMEFLECVERGCSWNPFSGRFVCDDGSGCGRSLGV